MVAFPRAIRRTGLTLHYACTHEVGAKSLSKFAQSVCPNSYGHVLKPLIQLHHIVVCSYSFTPSQCSRALWLSCWWPQGFLIFLVEDHDPQPSPWVILCWRHHHRHDRDRFLKSSFNWFVIVGSLEFALQVGLFVSFWDKRDLLNFLCGLWLPMSLMPQMCFWHSRPLDCCDCCRTCSH